MGAIVPIKKNSEQYLCTYTFLVNCLLSYTIQDPLTVEWCHTQRVGHPTSMNSIKEITGVLKDRDNPDDSSQGLPSWVNLYCPNASN